MYSRCYLRSGALVEGVAVASEQGTPQGEPFSPLLANTKSAATSWAGKAGCGGTGGHAFGNSGTTGGVGGASCSGWGCGVARCA